MVLNCWSADLFTVFISMLPFLVGEEWGLSTFHDRVTEWPM